MPHSNTLKHAQCCFTHLLNRIKVDILTIPGAGAKSSLSVLAGGTSGRCFQTPQSLWWETPCLTELQIYQQQIKKKFNPCQM